MRWIRSHDITLSHCNRETWKELLSLGEQIWDANQNGTLADLRCELKSDYVKVPLIRKDLGQMRGTDLTQWIFSRGVIIGKNEGKNKTQVLVLAEKTRDAMETGTLDNLKRRLPVPWHSVKVSEIRDDLRQMTVKNLASWTRSQGVSFGSGLRKEGLMALAERTWDTIEDGTLDDLKEDRNPKRGY